MTGLSRILDRRRAGTRYTDRMERILRVCRDCGLLWHDEKVTFRNGETQRRRVTDIQATNQVLVTPQYEKYGLQVNPRVLPRLKRMGPQFAYALNVANTAVEVDGNIVYVRVPIWVDESNGLVTFQEAWAIAPNVPSGSVLLGVDEDHNQLVLELISPTNVHAAVIGMTGSGKSTLMRTMVLSALLSGDAQVALFDPSRGFLPLSGHPLVWRGGLFSTAEDCEAGLAALTRSMGRDNARLIYAFVDEVPDLIMQRPKIKDHLARLAQAGRHAGIHLVIGAQHLLASEAGPMTMRNIPVRLVGRVSDRSAAYQAAGHGDSGAEHLRGRGDFIVANGSATKHFQVAYASDAYLVRWARRFPPREPCIPVRAGQAAPPGRSRRTADACPGSNRGRPKDDISPEAIVAIQRYMKEHRVEPSLNWVYRTTKDLFPWGGYNRSKARRAIDSAQQGG